jgi:hypothetical protein
MELVGAQALALAGLAVDGFAHLVQVIPHGLKKIQYPSRPLFIRGIGSDQARMKELLSPSSVN